MRRIKYFFSIIEHSRIYPCKYINVCVYVYVCMEKWDENIFDEFVDDIIINEIILKY